MKGELVTPLALSFSGQIFNDDVTVYSPTRLFPSYAQPFCSRTFFSSVVELQRVRQFSCYFLTSVGCNKIFNILESFIFTM